MLTEIYIKNYILVPELRMSFGKGLTVISGETGAGKSIIVGSIGLIFGDSAAGIEPWDKGQPIYLEASFIPFRDKATEAMLREIGAEEEEELILAREISVAGKSTYYLGGRRTSAAILRELKPLLLDFHHQRDQQKILQSGFQLELLDRYGETTVMREDFGAMYRQIRTDIRSLDELIKRQEESRHMLELYKYQYNELQEAAISAGEDLELQSEYELLNNSAEIATLCQEIHENLFEKENSLFDEISRYSYRLEQFAKMDITLAEAHNSISEALSSLQESSLSLDSAKGRITHDPGRLEFLEERLNLINGLLYKHKVKDIAELLELFEERKRALKSSDELIKEIEEAKLKLDIDHKKLREMANKLSQRRTQAAKNLAIELRDSIRKLAIKDAQFEIRIDKISDTEKLSHRDISFCSESGQDAVSFLFSANPGAAPKPLQAVASGGEMSRILLGIKEIISAKESPRLIVLDEIDVGIGGKTADYVARCIYNLAKHSPVLCITHLAQIAAYADHHVAVEKKGEERVGVSLRALDKKEQKVEIARMLSGTITDASLKHAKELLLKNIG